MLLNPFYIGTPFSPKEWAGLCLDSLGPRLLFKLRDFIVVDAALCCTGDDD